MSECKLNRYGYTQVIEDDIDFLKRNLPENLFNCLTCSHIINVLRASIDLLYDNEYLKSNI